MHIKRIIQLAGIPAAVALAVASCGGGTSQTGAAATGSTVGVSSGPITGFGSVFVNGVEFDTSGAKVTINGSTKTPSDLKVGMMVQVDGDIGANGTSGTATKITYNDEVQGVVDSIDVAHNTLVVMGQSVVVDSMTVFHGATGIADLKVGNVVEVSGMVDSTGTIHATRIELRSVSFTAGGTLNIRGQVSKLDTANSTFDIGAQTVNYATADLNGVPAGLSNGMTVEVKSTQGLNAQGQLVASAIEGISNNVRAESGDEMELKGLVTAFASLADFSVNGQPVTTTSSTRFEHGGASSVALNARVEVEGTVNASGVLVAHDVNVEPRPGIEIVADVQAVDPTAGTFTVMGQQFTVDANTTYRDESSMQARFFRIKDIAIGDRLDVRGYESAGTLTATRIERLNASAGALVELKAGVTAVNNPDLTVLGVNVITDGTTAFRLGETAATATAFFTAVAAGDVVDVRGNLTGDGAIQAASVGRGDH